MPPARRRGKGTCTAGVRSRRFRDPCQVCRSKVSAIAGTRALVRAAGEPGWTSASIELLLLGIIDPSHTVASVLLRSRLGDADELGFPAVKRTATTHHASSCRSRRRRTGSTIQSPTIATGSVTSRTRYASNKPAPGSSNLSAPNTLPVLSRNSRYFKRARRDRNLPFRRLAMASGVPLLMRQMSAYSLGSVVDRSTAATG